MREVVVTVGPRASGKSTFCEKVLSLDPSIVEVSRDKILTKLFGETSLNPYTGDHIYGWERTWKAAKEALTSQNNDVILDIWNGDNADRRSIVKKLRDLGVSKVIAWYFITPVEIVEDWFWKKSGIARISELRSRRSEEGLTFYLEDTPRRDHETFHRLASSIDSDGFDEIVQINPMVTRPEHIRSFQISLKF